MAKKPDGDKPHAIVAFPSTPAERTKLRNKAEFGDKIYAFRKARGFSQPQLAEMIGVTKNSITNWEKGTSRPELAIIPKLCTALGISADIFFGMPLPENTLNDSELEHMKLYRSLDRYKQRSVDALMESMIENDMLAFREQCYNAFSYVPHTELPASAGTGMPLADSYETEHIFLRNSRSVCRANAVITVTGDSMLPTFHDGDELLVEYTPEIAEGEIGIFIVAGEGFVKEYQPDGLHSHNPKYKTIRPTQDDNFRCVGRVLDVITEDMLPTQRELAVLNEVYASKRDN